MLARRFSDDPASNGFALLERYERGLRSQLLRLMKHYDQLQKHRATVLYDKDEPPCPDEGKKPAWTEEKARAQREWAAEQQRLFDEGKEVDPDWLQTHEIQHRQREEANVVATPASPSPTPNLAKRTQSMPTENVISAQLAGKCAIGDGAPPTKRSQLKGRVVPAGARGCRARIARRPQTHFTLHRGGLVGKLKGHVC